MTKFDVFLTVSEFKSALNIQSLDVKKRTKDSGEVTKFATANGKNYKVQQDLDASKPMRWAYMTAEGIEEGCLVNIDESNVVTEVSL